MKKLLYILAAFILTAGFLLSCGDGADGGGGDGGGGPLGDGGDGGGGPTVKTVSTYNGTNAAILSDGSLWTWGLNSHGSVGDGTTGSTSNRNKPVRIEGNWESVSAGRFHTVAIKSDGTVWSWGWNIYGEVGDGTTTQRNSPVMIEGSYASVYASYDATIAFKSDGSYCAWGENYKNRLGLNSAILQYHVPTASSTNNWDSISMSVYHSLGIRNGGQLWTWGFGDSYELGYGNTLDQLTPTRLGTESNWASVSAGTRYSAAIKTNGTLWTWGRSTYGELGDGAMSSTKQIPTQVGTDTNWAQVSARSYNIAAIKTNGDLWIWGRNDSGQLGIGTSGAGTDKTSPVQVPGKWKQVVVGGSHTLGIKSDGTLWAWGGNGSGQLGDGTYTSRNTPVKVIFN